MRTACLAEIRLSPVSSSCEYVAPICLSVVGRHRLAEVSDSPLSWTGSAVKIQLGAGVLCGCVLTKE
jgi:hypothetical protein